MIEPLLNVPQRESPVWLSWLAHVELTNFLLQHEFRRSDIERTKVLVSKYRTAYSKVPEYAGWTKPKHHFLDHLHLYLALFGPFRGVWCFPFEAFLQVLKRMFKMTNYKIAPYTGKWQPLTC
jgi:hypothetical protein